MTGYLGPLFGRLACLLPPMLAEDEVSIGVLRCDLVADLTNVASRSQVETVLAVAERLFCALVLLNATSAAEGQWRFNSYPAWLVARSLLETLATDHHTLFDPGYWSQQPAEIEVDEQRALLRRLENARVDYHPNGTAQSIRFVYVAWAVIRLGNRFLLYAREDKVRQDARGHFGLPGGRFKLSDAPVSSRPLRAEHDFAYGLSHWPRAYLRRSLHRELREELHLSEQNHYTTGTSLDITPYRRIEGARNHYSLTEYHISLFPLQLNTHGVLQLFERLQRSPELFAWFTADELSAERNALGQRAFVTALVEHFGPDLKELMVIPQAFEESYLLRTPQIGVDIPLTPEHAITSGRSGKPSREHAARLTEAEHRWLWVLAWHAKSLPITKVNSFGLLPSGWISFNDIAVVVSLRDKLIANDLPLVEIENGRYARLSISPRMIYFAPDFFRYRLHGDAIRGRLELSSLEISTPLGILKHDAIFIELNTSLAGELRHLDGVDCLADNTKNSEHFPRMLDAAVGFATKSMGIRQLVANVDKSRQYRRLLIAKMVLRNDA